MQLYTSPNMFVAYYTSKTNSSPCDFYKMTLVAAFGFLMALSALRAPPLPQPSKFSRFKVLLTSYQASRSHQQAKQRLAASKGHIEGRRRPPEAAGGRDSGGQSKTTACRLFRHTTTYHHYIPLQTLMQFLVVVGGGGTASEAAAALAVRGRAVVPLAMPGLTCHSVLEQI